MHMHMLYIRTLLCVTSAWIAHKRILCNYTTSLCNIFKKMNGGDVILLVVNLKAV